MSSRIEFHAFMWQRTMAAPKLPTHMQMAKRPPWNKRIMQNTCLCTSCRRDAWERHERGMREASLKHARGIIWLLLLHDYAHSSFAYTRDRQVQLTESNKQSFRHRLRLNHMKQYKYPQAKHGTVTIRSAMCENMSSGLRSFECLDALFTFAPPPVRTIR